MMNGDIITAPKTLLNSIPLISELPHVRREHMRIIGKFGKNTIIFQGNYPQSYLHVIHKKFEANYEFVILKCEGKFIRYAFELICMAAQQFEGVEILDVYFTVDKKEKDCKRACENAEVTFRISNPKYTSEW